LKSHRKPPFLVSTQRGNQVFSTALSACSSSDARLLLTAESEGSCLSKMRNGMPVPKCWVREKIVRLFCRAAPLHQQDKCLADFSQRNVGRADSSCRITKYRVLEAA